MKRILEYPPDVQIDTDNFQQIESAEADKILNGGQDDIVIVASCSEWNPQDLPWLIREDGTIYSNEAEGIFEHHLMSSTFEDVEGVTFLFYKRR